MTGQDLAGRIQHTLYDVGTSQADLERHCAECVEHGFNAAMVPARFVAAAVRALAGTDTLVVTAVDFPIGLMSTSGRVAEATAAVAAGAAQVDLAVPVGLLHDGEDDLFAESIAVVVEAIDPIAVKVMLELPLLTDAEKAAAVELACEAGAAYLKNASSGQIEVASPESIRYLAERAPEGVLVKASGGIKSRQQVVELLSAGAAKVGTSAGIAIVTDTSDAQTQSY